MKDVRMEQCQYCGGREWIEGTVASYGGAYVTTGVFRNAGLFATVCRDCGSVIRLFCKTPEKLYPKNERK